MIFEKEIMEMTQPKFEFPTEMSILKEYYENEITLLNYVIEYKNALSNVNESTELAVIQEEFNNKAINKIKEIIKKFIEFCKNILRTVKDKIKKHTTYLNQKLDTIEYYIKYKNADNIIIKIIDPDYIQDFEKEVETSIKLLSNYMRLLQDVVLNDKIDKYDILDIKNKIQPMKIESLDPNKYISTHVIRKDNASKIVNSIKESITITEHNRVIYETMINNFIKNSEAYLKHRTGYSGEKSQEIVSTINLILAKSQLISNAYASVINGYMIMINNSVDSIIKKAKIKESNNEE